MLPKIPEPPISGKHTIFVNPNFKRGMTQFASTRDRNSSQGIGQQNYNVKPHVNPLFLPKSVVSSARKAVPRPAPTSAIKPKPTIHMNPKIFVNPMFLQNDLLETPHSQHQRPSTGSQIGNSADEVRTDGKNMYKYAKNVSKKENLNMKIKIELPSNQTVAPLLHLSRTKLVRKPAETVKTNLPENNPIPTPLHAYMLKANTKLDISNPKKRYKIDRTKTAQNASTSTNQNLLNPGIQEEKYIHKSKPNPSSRVSPRSRTGVKLINHSKLNKKLKLIKINNILYKTTRNKLLRKDLEKTKSMITAITKRKEDLSILQNSVSKMNARNHISNAKSRSMQQLRKRYVTTNEPCVVFQRLGKCAAFQKGRCNKKHDKEQVVICQKYLRGECFDSDCLLSHNVCLAKMPVCKFYLQANCFRENCPYLHKKLSQNAEICPDFVRGYCHLAEKCNKRHEFMCPDLALKKKCVHPGCSFCKPKKQFKLVASKAKERKHVKRGVLIDKILSLREEAIKKLEDAKSTKDENTDDKDKDTTETVEVMKENDVNDDAGSTTRYFDTPQTNTNANDTKVSDPALNIPEGEVEEVSSSRALLGPSILRKRPKLGYLPAFIPLS